MNLEAHGATDVGRVRRQNEDAYLVDAGLRLAVVADGMGGHACGEVASQMAVHVFRDTIDMGRTSLVAHASEGRGAGTRRVRRLLRGAMRRASRAIYDEATRDPTKRGMGTTCTALLVSGETAFVAHVGDSRAYLLRSGRVVPLTRDHSLLNVLVEDGRLTEDEALSDDYAGYRGALARAVGIERDVVVDTAAFEALPGDAILLASDGLTRHVDDDEIGALLSDGSSDPAHRLVDLANERGGSDNISVVVTRFSGDGVDELQRCDDFAERLTAVRRLPLFRELTLTQALEVASSAPTVSVSAGDELLAPFADERVLYVVLSGRVRVVAPDDTASVIREGETFGALTCVRHEEAESRAIAVTESRLVRLEAEELVEILGRSALLDADVARAVRRST